MSSNIEKIRKGNKFRTYRNMEFHRKDKKVYREMEIEPVEGVHRETLMAQTRRHG